MRRRWTRRRGGDDVDEEDEEGASNAEINFARRIMRFTAQSRGVIVLIMMSKMWNLPEPNSGKTGVTLLLPSSRICLYNH